MFWTWGEQYMSSWMSSPRYGHLCLEVLVEGEFHDYYVSLQPYGDLTALAGDEVNVPVILRNTGTKAIESIDYVVETNGIETEQRHVELDTPFRLIDTDGQVVLTMKAETQPSYATKTLRITHLNGQPNAATTTEASAKGSLISVAQTSPRRTVMEEFTGAWCGWCPRGDTGMKRLSEDFGADFIGIAIHQGDPMEILPYGNILIGIHDYPSAWLNREGTCDPYAGVGNDNYGVKQLVDYLQQEIVEAAVELKARWATDEQLAVTAETSVTFQYDRADAPYALAYVLTADSLSHPEDNAWDQKNFFHYFAEDPEYSGNPDYADYLGKDEDLNGMVYNHVAVEAYGVDEGLDESISAPLVTGAVQHHTFDIDIDGNELIMNKANLHLAALLINRQTGCIVNACQVAIGEALPAAISTVGADAAVPAGRFDLTGRHATNHTGISIVRRADGSVVKIAK